MGISHALLFQRTLRTCASFDGSMSRLAIRDDCLSFLDRGTDFRRSQLFIGRYRLIEIHKGAPRDVIHDHGCGPNQPKVDDLALLADRKNREHIVDTREGDALAPSGGS
jgi:hypothetical protein